MFYWLLKWVLLGPLLKLIFRPYAEGTENVPEEGAGDPRQQPPVVLRLAVHAAGDPAPGHVRRQGRVLHHARAQGLAAEDVLLRRRPGADRPLERRRRPPARSPPASRSWRAASCSASIPRAPGRTTAGSTAAGPASRGWPSRPRCRSSRSRSIGTDVVAPPGKIFGRYARPHVRFGKPLDFSRYEGMEDDRFVLRSITDEIMYEIMDLSGQEYVDVYATKAKADAQQQPRPPRAGPRPRRRRPEPSGRATTGSRERLARRQTPTRWRSGRC